MPVRNSQTRYGSVAKWFHWTTALLIIGMIPLGIIARDLPWDTSEQLARKALLFQVHKSFGILIFFVALARIFWAIQQPKPAPLHPDRRIESFVAEVVHWLLYGSLVLVPLTGWIMHAATEGFAPIPWPFSQDLPFVPNSESLAHLFSALHFTFERVLAFSILLHIAGALKHHVIDRDVTLKRILPGKAKGGKPGARHSKKPLFAALTVWALALPVGAMVFYLPGLKDAETIAATQLSESTGDWQVTEGGLSITVSQFNTPVTGSFADWNAAITFDPTPGLETAGSVEVEIAIASLTLGTVTGQAMGPDFFDAPAFPVATFRAEIIPAADGYRAIGTLTLKGIEKPVAFDFALQTDGDTAEMHAEFELMRFDFTIGSKMPDETALAFPVVVSVGLTAIRATDSAS